MRSTEDFWSSTDVTEECGPEDKQHSWAVTENPEEFFFYGPYFPDKSRGSSEDVVIQQTQELLETGAESAIFTQNSLCLARKLNRAG